jgi:hypothetical protein
MAIDQWSDLSDLLKRGISREKRAAAASRGTGPRVLVAGVGAAGRLVLRPRGPSGPGFRAGGASSPSPLATRRWPALTYGRTRPSPARRSVNSRTSDLRTLVPTSLFSVSPQTRAPFVGVSGSHGESKPKLWRLHRDPAHNPTRSHAGILTYVTFWTHGFDRRFRACTSRVCVGRARAVRACRHGVPDVALISATGAAEVSTHSSAR